MSTSVRSGIGGSETVSDVIENNPGVRVPILAYHRIAEEGPASLARYRTAPREFATQMKWLRDGGFRSVTSPDVIGGIELGHGLPERAIMLTFDDGYLDFFEVAFPILEKVGFKAEIMIATDHVGSSANWDARHGTPAGLLDWKQIRSLSAAGMRFGSHMATHSYLCTLADSQVIAEASRSKAALENALGVACHSFAAPFGECDARLAIAVRSCGYRVGFSTEYGVATARHSLLRLPRIEIKGGWSIDQFRRKLAAATCSEWDRWRSIKSALAARLPGRGDIGQATQFL